MRILRISIVPTPRAYVSQAMGRRTVKTLPLPSSVSTSMVPPLASTRFLLVANPNPMPQALVVNNGSKSLCRFSSGMPHPVSETRMRLQGCRSWFAPLDCDWSAAPYADPDRLPDRPRTLIVRQSAWTSCCCRATIHSKKRFTWAACAAGRSSRTTSA